MIRPACNCCETAVVVGRRAVLTGASLLAVAGSGMAQTKPFRIDVHHHIVPPPWLDALKSAKRDNPILNNWTPQKSLDDMDKAGIATSIVSPTTPQVNFLADAAEAARVARESNDWTKKLTTEFPGRFGMFAMLPMPHIDASLKEIAYVLDVLQADGIGMMTDYGDKWLGYDEFRPVFDELNRRKATVYTHPTTANCCVNLVRGITDAAVEWGADTTRTIASLIFSGASMRYNNINFIFSHGGGVLTAVAERLQIQMVATPPYKGKITRDMVDHELQRFYYDTAQVSNAVTIGALAKLVPVSQIVFGTDYPYRTGAEHVEGLRHAFTPAALRHVERDNALRILPRQRKG